MGLDDGDQAATANPYSAPFGAEIAVLGITVDGGDLPVSVDMVKKAMPGTKKTSGFTLLYFTTY